MLIDCRTCTVRGDACADCVVTFLTIPVRRGHDEPSPAVVTASADGPGLADPPVPGAFDEGRPRGTLSGAGVDLDDAERRALSVLAEGGLVPPLRLVRAV